RGAGLGDRPSCRRSSGEQELGVVERSHPEGGFAVGEVEVPGPPEADVLDGRLVEARAPAPKRLRVVEPDLLEVAHSEPRVARHGTGERGDRGDQAAGKDVALDPVRRLAIAAPAAV